MTDRNQPIKRVLRRIGVRHRQAVEAREDRVPAHPIAFLRPELERVGHALRVRLADRADLAQPLPRGAHVE